MTALRENQLPGSLAPRAGAEALLDLITDVDPLTLVKKKRQFKLIDGRIEALGKEVSGPLTLPPTSHVHANLALLDTYTQLEADLASAVSLKHEQLHVASHATGQPDALSPAAIGALALAGGTLTGPLQVATINGGVNANDDITIRGTTHGTRTSSYVILQPNGGNVGIGTTNPLRTLHVEGSVAVKNNAGIHFQNGAGILAGSTTIIADNTNTLKIRPVGGSVDVLSITPDGKAVFGGSVIQSVPNAAPSDTALANGSASFYLDEGGNALKVRVRYSDGTLKTGTLALA